MSTEINQAMDSKEQENTISCILHDKFFSIDAGQSELKSALSEHLNRVKSLFSNSPDKYKLFSLLAVGGIYAVEKDMESAAKHREMLLDIWRNECRAICGNDAVEELERTAQAMIQKNVVYAAKITLRVDVSCNQDGNATYTYGSSALDIKDTADNMIMVPGWNLVDRTYMQRWMMLHFNLSESYFEHNGEDLDASIPDVPYIERYDMDISDVLQGVDAQEFELSEDAIEPGENFDVTFEGTLPSVAFWLSDIGDAFSARSYKPFTMDDIWYSLMQY